MRVLIALPPANAHLLPLVPLAWALQAEGHEVRVATHPALAPRVVAAGLSPVVVGDDVDLGAAARACGDDPAMDEIAELLDLDPDDANFTMAVRIFALNTFRLYLGAADPASPQRRAVDELVDVARTWRPHLVLWDTYFFPAAIAAAACGAAHARVLLAVDHFGWLRTTLRRTWASRGDGGDDPMVRHMAPVLRAHGLDFSEELLLGRWTLDLKPASMRLPLDLDYQPVRRVPYTGAAPVDPWLTAPPARPRVALSMGVSTRALFADRARAFDVEGLLGLAEDLGLEMVATLDAGQLAGVGRIPDGVRVFDYLPLAHVLPSCSAVIHHGGGGTMAAAAWFRLPQVVLPGIGSDRVENGAYVADRGAGLVGPRFDGGALSVDAVRGALARVLEEPAFAEGAAGLHAEMRSAPSPAEAVRELEERVGAREPV